MKRTALLLLAMTLPFAMSADESKTELRDMAGIWQQVQNFKGERRFIRLPVWKILHADGTFQTFLIANKSAQSIITNAGTYKVTSDSTYTEHVTSSLTDPSLVGRDNHITYYMKDKDNMSITYRMPGAKRNGQEQWIRVKMEMPDDEIEGNE